MRRAKSVTERGFDPNDRHRLRRALHDVREVRTYRRVQAVLLVARGRTVPEVAEMTGVKPWAVYAWIRAYLQAHDPDSLQDAPRSGRPRAAPAITDRRIEQEFRRDPMRLGYNSTGWTVTLLANHLRRKYGNGMSVRTLRRRMHDVGLCWKRPRYTYANKDPNRAQKKGGLSGGSDACRTMRSC
jgi:transposase